MLQCLIVSHVYLHPYPVLLIGLLSLMVLFFLFSGKKENLDKTRR